MTTIRLLDSIRRRVRRGEPLFVLTEADLVAALDLRVFADPPVSVRRAGPADAVVLASFGEDARPLLVALDDPAQAVLVAEQEGEPRGAVLLRPRVLPVAGRADGPEMELALLHVSAEWRGQGIGSELMRAATTHANLRGFRSLWLRMPERDAESRRFLRARGFRGVGAASGASARHLARPLRRKRGRRGAQPSVANRHPWRAWAAVQA